MTVRKLAVPALLLALLGGCAKTGEIDPSGGITAVRSPCPQVGVPAGTGDITLFSPASSRDASAIDVVADIANVQSSCDDASGRPDIATTISFDVQARRTRTDGERDVTFPYYVTVVQGGTSVVSKRIGRATVHFAAGQPRAEVHAQATAIVSRAAATLPADVREQLTRKRKAGEEDAAIDPLTDPKVRGSVQRATFEALVGFQLTNDQLQYNVTR